VEPAGGTGSEDCACVNELDEISALFLREKLLTDDSGHMEAIDGHRELGSSVSDDEDEGSGFGYEG
jgi:hypothetical protein